MVEMYLFTLTTWQLMFMHKTFSITRMHSSIPFPHYVLPKHPLPDTEPWTQDTEKMLSAWLTSGPKLCHISLNFPGVSVSAFTPPLIRPRLCSGSVRLHSGSLNEQHARWTVSASPISVFITNLTVVLEEKPLYVRDAPFYWKFKVMFKHKSKIQYSISHDCTEINMNIVFLIYSPMII